MSEAKKICMVVRQAGTANAFYPLILQLKKLNYQVSVYAFTKAAEIFSTKNIQYKLIEDVDSFKEISLQEKADIVITGTSFEVSADEKIWKFFKDTGSNTIGFVDQWCNIHERFIGVTTWPDTVWVIDEIAKARFENKYHDKVLVEVSGNPSFDFLTKFSNKEILQRNNDAVFITQPLSSSQGAIEYGYNHVDSFECAYRLLSDLQKESSEQWRLNILLHPIDDKTKWENIIESKGNSLKVSFLEKGNKDFIYKKARLVMGLTSVLLAECASCALPVISFQINKKNDIDSYGIDAHPGILKIQNIDFASIESYQEAVKISQDCNVFKENSVSVMLQKMGLK